MSLLAFDRAACERGGRLLFEGLSFRIAAGEAALVTGPNGVGKSSLLRMAAGLLAPVAGTIARGAPAAWAGEAAALDQRRTLGEALGFWARIDGKGAADVGRGLAAMGIEALADVPVRMLSTGQRKRAMLARVIAGGQPLWLLDEPGNGLDTASLDRLAAAMAAHRAAGGALLVATHQPLGLDDAQAVAL